MKRELVYDLPTRIFHWLFVFIFVGAFFIAKTVDDESPVYSYHMLLGLVLSLLVLLRIIWGFVGSRYARFAHFSLNPREFWRYLSGIFKGDSKKWNGHNPASSWAAIIMMSLVLGLGVTGVLMTSGGNIEAFEDLHEVFANIFLLTAGLHVLGVLLHTIRFSDGIAFGMLDGKKSDVVLDKPISRHSFVAMFLVAITGAFSVHLKNNYDPNTQNLNFFGTQLKLGESEGDDDLDRNGKGSKAEVEEDGDDDDD